ncbi:hypothetical protein IAW_05890 [Bacillus cereus str. Schrouff]|uniref:DUF5512 family protein n=1 Tax=Bacillus cereus TaxID=1396 RepID=UPI00032D80A2|nr:DUF5512 family protein [Bacillus cereus]EOO04883.1 hypothetical protein IAW_05890 [Bacillus cereus str. Schrouff]EOO81063.1 hypothetical protein IGY_06075 [Bacillus cereus K-5975c]
MLKRFKFLSAVSALFISITVLLAGCGGSSVPYKKGDTYKDSDKNFIEVTAENEWKVKGYQNYEALYRVEPMEYKGGAYSVVSITLKEKMTHTDPWLILNGDEYFIIESTEKGFNSVYMGSSYSKDTKWKKFKNELEKTNDQEALLKKEFENNKKTLKKFEKTN